MEHEPIDPDPMIRRQAFFNDVVHDLYTLLPRAPGETEVRPDKVEGALDQIAGLVPFNAAEAKLAAHVVAQLAHAEDVMRETMKPDNSDERNAKLRAQSASMTRQANCTLRTLIRLQNERRKRESIHVFKADTVERVTARMLTKAAEKLPRPKAPDPQPQLEHQPEPEPRPEPQQLQPEPHPEADPAASPQPQPQPTPAARLPRFVRFTQRPNGAFQKCTFVGFIPPGIEEMFVPDHLLPPDLRRQLT